MATTIESGLLEQVYVDFESAYNTLATPASTDAIRHRECRIRGRNNREPSDERTGVAGRGRSLPRRHTCEVELETRWEPSGTLATPSYMGLVLKNLFGAQHAASLTTTVSASPSPTASVFTVASATGLQVGDTIIVTTPNGREATRIQAIATAQLTVDTLSTAPATGAAVVHGVSYSLANAISQALSVFKYSIAGGFKESAGGFLPDRGTIAIDGTTEVLLSISGPAARRYANGSTPAKPASHTTVGNPLGGLIGNVYLGANAFPMTKLSIAINNATWLRNAEIGTQYANGYARQNFRDVTLSVEFYLENEALFTAGEGNTPQVVRCALGDTNGSMLGLVAPNVLFEIPDIGGGVGPKVVTASGVCYHTNGNDEIFAGEL